MYLVLVVLTTFVYWPRHLNVKVLPDDFIDACEQKYEEFIEWWKQNWQLGVQLAQEQS